VALCASSWLPAQDTRYAPQGEQFPGPPAKTDTAAWLKELKQYREERRVRAGLSGEMYDRPEFGWAQSSFMQPQSMVEDRYFYDAAARRYTVDRFLADLDQRYGGIDSVLLWPVYPNIGIDNRNQFDLLRDMPGGTAGLREMVAEFHRRGVRVLFPHMPWDVGSRAEPRGFPETLAALMKEIGADGVNGDTFGGVPRSYRTASDAIGHPLVFEPEGYSESDEMLNWDGMSWGYWKYPFIPMVSRGKWLEPRHMVNVCDRWNKDKTDNLQSAFFNGVGYETWENIWGIWNGITERDAEAIRRVAKVERRFAKYLVSPGWEPHTPTIPYGVFAGKFPLNGRILWTIVNRTVYHIDGPQLGFPALSGMHYFDLWHGVELKPTAASGGGIVLSATAEFRFEVHGIEIEGGDDIGVDVQYPGEDSPRRHHAQTLSIPAFYIDKYPVTNRQFADFLEAANYHPADDRNFLEDWNGGKYRAGWENRPVTWVSLEDARAYARWAGKRLPHEWEWQYAAQGLDGRAYPWGGAWCNECAPKQEHGRDLGGPAPVDAFPKGASPFGVMDLTGNIWQWTDEFQDEHTRAATLRGGGYYRPSASRWYFPSAYQLDEHGKYLLMAPSKDRAGTLGFRCVKEAQ
jgi:formylglycine-generating enzyme required for sulfatase activity